MTDTPPTHMRKLLLTIEVEVRDMTPEEFFEAGGLDNFDDEDGTDTLPNSDGWVQEMVTDNSAMYELKEALLSGMDSSEFPDMFAGTNVFVVTENAKCLDAKWVDD